MTEVQKASQLQAGRSSSAENQEFLVKAFIQAPDAEIKIEGRLPQAVRWSDRWQRKCGNPATSIIASR